MAVHISSLFSSQGPSGILVMGVRAVSLTAVFVMCMASLAAVAVASSSEGDEISGGLYGVDVSFPTHTHTVIGHNGSGNVLGGDRQGMYRDYLQGCYDAKGKAVCDKAEQTRIKRNLLVPQSMKNFTETGYLKAPCPSELYNLLKEFFDANKETNQRDEYRIPETISNINIWKTQTTLVNLQQHDPERDAKVRELVRTSLGGVVREWTGNQLKLKVSDCYGIRIYKTDSLLAPHMDYVPLIIGVIINVDQDVTEDWPLEVYNHKDGQAYNLTFKPGEMALFESHSVIHARPFPLRGKYFAYYFARFGLVDSGFPNATDANAKTTCEKDSCPNGAKVQKLPSYMVENSPEAKRLDPANAAKNDDVDALSFYTKVNRRDLLHKSDINGWQPIHEAARKGNYNSVKYLLKRGGNINAKTNAGMTPLMIAKKELESAKNKVAKNIAKMEKLVNYLEQKV